MKQRALSFLLAAVLTLALAPAAWAAESFSDVPSSHWAYSDIMACAEQGIVTGFADGSFHPNDEVTSAQFVAMLTRTFYSSDVAAAQGAGGAWYAPNAQAANAHNLLNFWSNYMVEINNEPINRNLMAVVLSNIMDDFGKSASDSEKAVVEIQITDWNKVGAPHRREVSNCYAKGILTGMSDGRFAGFSNMTRAQACAVIVRIMNLIGGATPSSPAKPQQPAQPSTPVIKSAAECIPSSSKEGPPYVYTVVNAGGKLSNGKEATPENVMEFLEAFKEKYPEGTSWTDPKRDPDTYYYPFGNGSKDVQTAADMTSKSGHGNIDLQYACGGWAAMVSDTIFGRTGAPPRQVTKTSDLRPGDILFTMSTKTNEISHVNIYLGPDPYSVNGELLLACGGNSGSTVSWNDGALNLETTNKHNYTLAFTRYPD